MKVTLAKNAGFCFGVRRATETVERLLKEGNRRVATLGHLIHNRLYLEELASRGVVSISIDEARALGIGIVRIKLDEIYSSDDCSVYFKSVLMRRICDHIASMTDSYAMEEYRKLYG